MIAPANGLLRLTRAVAFALTTVVLSLIAHVAAGGTSPAAATVLVLASITVLPAIWLMRRRRGIRPLLVALGVGEFLLHHAYMALSGGAMCHATGGGGHPHASHAVALECAGGAGATGMTAGAHLSLPMLLGHAVATVALAGLLAHGERVLWGLCSWLRASLPARPGPTPAILGRTTPAEGWLPPLRRWATAGCLSRRGPPREVRTA